MKSKQKNEIRVLGQRSIPSSFLFQPISNPNKDSKNGEENKDTNKNSSISLSDFLHQKLHMSPVLNKKIVQGKSRPFKSPLGVRDGDSVTIDHLTAIRKEEEKGKSTVIDQVIFDQFKPTSIEKRAGDVASSDIENGTSGSGTSFLDNIASFPAGGVGSSSSNSEKHTTIRSRNPFQVCRDSRPVGEAGTSNSNIDQPARRRNLSEDANGNKTARKRLLALGDGPRTKRRTRGRGRRFQSNKNEKPSFNYYGNGNGWWDCDMEGVDTEEVGLGDVWEGVGSTTFGVIDWH